MCSISERIRLPYHLLSKMDTISKVHSCDNIEMSTVAVERPFSQHQNGLQSIAIDSTSRSVVEMDGTCSLQAASMEDIKVSSVEPSTSRDDQDSKKREKKAMLSNFKKTAKNVVSGISFKKKGTEEEKSRSHEELPAVGDQAKGKSTSFYKMMNFSHPNNKMNKMWTSLNKTFSTSPSSSATPPPFNELNGSRSTMTLGRFFGRKREQQNFPPLQEGQKAHTLGRILNFMPNRKSREQAD